MINTKDYFIIFAFSALLLVGFILFYNKVTSVEYSLNQIALNYKTHKLRKFLRYVDTRSLITNYINRMPSPENNVFGLVYSGIDRNKETQLYTQRINMWVGSGYSTDPLVNLQLKSNWVKDSLNYNKSIFYGVDNITHKGDIATIGLKLFHPRYDTTTILDLNFRKKEYHWELYDMPNLNETIERLDSLERVMYPNSEVRPVNLLSLTHFLL